MVKFLLWVIVVICFVWRVVAADDSGDMRMVPDVDEDDEESSVAKQVVNFASVSAGAVVLESSPKAKGYHYLLNDDKDKYGIAPCAEKKWVVIGLSEDIVVENIVLSNYEKYSSSLDSFQVLGSTSYPVSEWMDLGTFSAKPELGDQSFHITTPAWGRYLKFRFLTHHADEFYCTLSQIKVHGSTVIQNLQKEVERSTLETIDFNVIFEDDNHHNDDTQHAERRVEPEGNASRGSQVTDAYAEEDQTQSGSDENLSAGAVEGTDSSAAEPVEAFGSIPDSTDTDEDARAMSNSSVGAGEGDSEADETDAGVDGEATGTLTQEKDDCGNAATDQSDAAANPVDKPSSVTAVGDHTNFSIDMSRPNVSGGIGAAVVCDVTALNNSSSADLSSDDKGNENAADPTETITSTSSGEMSSVDNATDAELESTKQDIDVVDSIDNLDSAGIDLASSSESSSAFVEDSLTVSSTHSVRHNHSDSEEEIGVEVVQDSVLLEYPLESTDDAPRQKPTTAVRTAANGDSRDDGILLETTDDNSGSIESRATHIALKDDDGTKDGAGNSESGGVIADCAAKGEATVDAMSGSSGTSCDATAVNGARSEVCGQNTSSSEIEDIGEEVEAGKSSARGGATMASGDLSISSTSSSVDGDIPERDNIDCSASVGAHTSCNMVSSGMEHTANDDNRKQIDDDVEGSIPSPAPVPPIEQCPTSQMILSAAKSFLKSAGDALIDDDDEDNNNTINADENNRKVETCSDSNEKESLGSGNGTSRDVEVSITARQDGSGDAKASSGSDALGVDSIAEKSVARTCNESVGNGTRTVDGCSNVSGDIPDDGNDKSTECDSVEPTVKSTEVVLDSRNDSANTNVPTVFSSGAVDDVDVSNIAQADSVDAVLKNISSDISNSDDGLANYTTFNSSPSAFNQTCKGIKADFTVDCNRNDTNSSTGGRENSRSSESENEDTAIVSGNSSVTVNISGHSGGVKNRSAVSCFESLRFSDFQAKMKAKFSSQQANVTDGWGGTIPASQDVFRTLMKKIISLEQNYKIVELFTIQIHECYQTMYREIESINKTALQASEEDLLKFVQRSLTSDVIRLAQRTISDEMLADSADIDKPFEPPVETMNTLHSERGDAARKCDRTKAVLTLNAHHSPIDCPVMFDINGSHWLAAVFHRVMHMIGCGSRGDDSVILEIKDLVILSIGAALISIVISISCVVSCVYLTFLKRY